MSFLTLIKSLPSLISFIQEIIKLFNWIQGLGTVSPEDFVKKAQEALQTTVNAKTAEDKTNAAKKWQDLIGNLN